MESKKNESKIVDLNKELPEFFVENLEERLETDPLLSANIFDVYEDSDYCKDYDICGSDHGCIEKMHCGEYY